ncbi:hypothetical protein HMPREF0027_1680 [Actinobacillus ureae ATCC 25976]|uniref:Uncharacterized protein n=1 Tax=Actinobacillus ureae ATCC 25976 TaxID=887324 RepID=E8KIL3_9PAST|nr:hypothetical protein HMPREF0027_1680 [Actinobacillus ureae ATCC 25976]
MLASSVVGSWYDKFGYQDIYFILGCVALGFTLFSIFTLTGKMNMQERYQLHKRNTRGA